MEEIKGSILVILSNISSFLAGFIVAIFAEPIRQRLFKPKLNLEFSKDGGCISKTYEAKSANSSITTEAFYIRIKVTNTSRIIARDCRAYLIDIEKQDEHDKFAPTVYCDSIQLAWSCQGRRDRYEGIDLSKGVNKYLDVIVTRNTLRKFDPQIMVKPFRYSSIFEETGVFRFTIQASANGADPKIIKLILDWKGIWDDFTVKIRLINKQKKIIKPLRIKISQRILLCLRLMIALSLAPGRPGWRRRFILPATGSRPWFLKSSCRAGRSTIQTG